MLRMLLALALVMLAGLSTQAEDDFVPMLHVSEVVPAPGAQQIASYATITVVFDRPVVPLMIVEDMDTLPQPLIFSPEITGVGEWVNTFVYTFTPDPLLPPDHEISVTVDEALMTADGIRLAGGYTWSFYTTPARINRIRLHDGSQNLLLPNIITYFNMTVATEVIEKYITLRPITDSRVTNAELIDEYIENDILFDTGEPIPGTINWDEEKSIAFFTPDNLLENETIYMFQVDQLALQREGGINLTGQLHFAFVTPPYPQILSTTPENETETSLYNGFQIHFNTFMDAESINERLIIEPEPQNFWGYQSSETYHASFSALPDTAYSIHIEPGIEDVYGNVYDQAIDFTYRTLPYPPSFDLRIPRGPVAFYNAYQVETGILVQHRNVNQLAIQLYTLTPDLFMKLMMEANRDRPNIYNYQPEITTLLHQWRTELPKAQDIALTSVLTLGPDSACNHTLESSLRRGNTVRIMQNSDVISFPVDGIQQFTALEGVELTLVGGPMCTNGAIWWQVGIGGSTGWLPETRNGVDLLQFVDSTQPARIQVHEGDALQPGLYFLRVIMDDPVPAESYYRTHAMMVMTANLTMKLSHNGLLVWATDVQSGEPIPNVQVMIYNSTGLVTAGLTNNDGVLTAEVQNVDHLTYDAYFAVLDTDRHFGIGMSGWSDGIDPGMFGQYAAFSNDPYTAAVYTDRQAYRPGETVYFRGIIRDRHDMTYTVSETLDTVVVTMNGDQITLEETIPLTAYGTFSGKFEIPETAGLGRAYNILIKHKFREEEKPLGSVSFSVAEFRLPEYLLNLTPGADDIAQGETLELLVEGEYYSGGPVSRADISYKVISSPLFFHYEGRERYNFSTLAEDMEHDREIAEDTGTTDQDGKFLLEMSTDFGRSGIGRRFDFEVTISDESNQTVSSRASVNVHAGQWYIGSLPDQYVNSINQDAHVNMLLVDWNSMGVPDQEINVEVFRRDWYSVQESRADGSTAWTWEYDDTSVERGVVTTDIEGKAGYTFKPFQGGAYYVLFSTRDELGNEILHQAQIWVSSRDYIPWKMNNSNRVDLIADHDEYKIGDVAGILIASPFQDPAYALVTIERAGIMTSEVIYLENNSYIHEIAIEEDFAPNVFVSVMIVSNVSGMPTFRMGMTQLIVDISQKEINVSIDANVDHAEPGQRVIYTIQTTDYEGNPVQAEVGVALTEAPSLAITGGNQYDHTWLLGRFYSKQGVGIRTSTPLTINTEQLTQQILDQAKGGGGGVGGLPVAYDIRSDFISTPYFHGSTVTDENGEVRVEITLPDNLTTWTLNAYAVTNAGDNVTRLGFATYDLVSTLPLLVRPVTPRFMVVGDELTLAALISNNTEYPLNVDVSLDFDGVVLQSDRIQTVAIPPADRVRVEWQVTVENTENVELIFRADSGEFSDASRPSLGIGDNQLIPVYRYEVVETVATSGILRDAGTRTEIIQLPADFELHQGELNIEVQPSLAGITIDSLDYLRNYPYQCIEQTVSRFLPNVMTYRAIESFDLAEVHLRNDLEDSVEFALQKLYVEQKVDGGWGWFMGEHSDPLTTAYALIGLYEARLQGFYVHENVIANAISYLNGQILAVGNNNEDWELNRQAFILYALARAEVPNIAATANLFEHHERLNLDAQAFLTLTLHKINPEVTIRTDTLLANFNAKAVTSATGTYWEDRSHDRWNWGTDLRTNALILQVMAELQPESELIPNVVRWLLDQRINRSWSTTQETAWTIMALTDWMLISGDAAPDYDYRVDFNGNKLTESVAHPETINDATQLVISIQDMLVNEANQLSLSRSDGVGTLYYTAHMSLNLPVPEVEALDRGVIIQRQYYRRLSDKSLQQVSEGLIGELIEVHLTVIAPNDLHYINVEDPIPAGVEPIDPRLSTNQQFGTNPTFNRENSRWGWNWWRFSSIEFHDEKVVLSASYLPAGTYEFVYLIRPVISGEYNVIPATGYEFYYPEVHGRSDGMLFAISN